MSPAESGVPKGTSRSTAKGAMTTAGGSPIYLSEWLTHKLIKRYLETFSDDTWPAVVKWTFVLGVLALRNGGFPCHSLSLADLKDIAKRNSDDLLTPPVREGLLQLLWRREGSSSGKEECTVSHCSVDSGAAAAPAAEQGAPSTAATTRTSAGVGEGSAAAADREATADAAADVEVQESSRSGRVRGREGGREAQGGAGTAATRRGRGEGIGEATRRPFRSVPSQGRSSRRYFSAAERRPFWCRGPSAAAQLQQRRDYSILQKPSSSWRSGDPITFVPLRGPYRGEHLPRPQRSSRLADRTYPLWWGDFFTSAAEEAAPLLSAAAAAGECCCSSSGNGAADAHDKEVLLQLAAPRQPCGEAPQYCSAADTSLSASVQQQQPQKSAQAQRLPGDCRMQICARAERPPTLSLGDRPSKEYLQEQEAFGEGETEEEMTTASTAMATPKFGAPSPLAAAGEKAAFTQKLQAHSKANHTCRAGVARLCSREGDGLLLSPRCRASCCSLASPLSVAALLQVTNEVEPQESQGPRGQAPQQCPGKRPQQQRGVLLTCATQQYSTCRRGRALLSGLQQQRRLRQRALHRSVAAAPHVVVDGFQSFRPAGEARWICTLRPAAHKHVPPQPPVAAGRTRRQPILPPLGPPTSSASGGRGLLGGRRSLQPQQLCQQHQHPGTLQMQLHTHHTQPAIVHSCRFPLSNAEGGETDLLSIGELPRAAVSPERLQEQLHGTLHSRPYHSLSSRAAMSTGTAQCAGRLAAAVGAARAAAIDAAGAAAVNAACAVTAAEASAAVGPCTTDCVLAGHRQPGTKHTAPLQQDSNTSSNVCTYSSFFDAALAAYTNVETADASESPRHTQFEPPHQQASHRLSPSVCPDDQSCAMSDDYVHAEGVIVARDGLCAPGQQPAATRFATGDPAKSTSDRRCSTSESSFSFSSLSVDEQSAGASPVLHTKCIHPPSAAAAADPCERYRQQRSTQRRTDVNQKQETDKQMQYESRVGTKEQQLQVHEVSEGDESDALGEAHTADGPNGRHAAVKDPDFAQINTDDEAVMVKEILQLYFSPDTERAAILQQRRSCAMPLPVGAGWKRKQLLQQSF